MSALAEMYVQGVLTRKVKAVTETLCGHEFSATSISEANKSLDAALTAFARRRLKEPYPYLILDARYERVREDGVIASQAVLIAVAVDGDGRRQVLAVELANRESRSSWRDFLSDLKQRGLRGVEFVVSDDHPGLKAAIREVLTEAVWQRCYVHFLRNALDYVPRKVDDDCLMELRWFYDRRDLAEVRRDLATWLGKWQGKYAKLCAWVEDNIEETLTFYRLPLAHHKHMKSTNMLERLNQEIKRRTHVVRIFPNAASCLRLVRALAVEAHENWLEAIRYLNMDHLKEPQEADAAASGMMMATHPARSSVVPCSPPSRTLRAGCAGGLRPSLTAAPRGAGIRSGRDEETPLSRTRKLHFASTTAILQTLTETTAFRSARGWTAAR